MRTETQKTISQWATETFGEAGSNARVLARALEEYAEFLRAYTSGGGKQIEELADTVIVLYRLAERMEVDLDAELLHSSWRYIDKNEELMSEALRCFATLLQYSDTHRDPRAVADLCDLFCCLNQLSTQLGGDLVLAIDSKMEVNRARVWIKDNTGHGYHKRQPATVV